MMKRFLTIILGVLLLLGLTSPVLGKQSAEDFPIPEKNGDYPDPEHPGVRVRVFVHEPRSPRPSPSPTPVPSCTDLDANDLVSAAGWKLPASWIYNLNPGSAPSSINLASVATIAAEGFEKQWEPAANKKINFQRGSDTDKNRSAYDGLNIITWGRTSGGALAVTYIRYSTATKLVVDVDTIMNLKFPWSWTPYQINLCGNLNTYDAQAVLTHEQGHWLGLDDEYTANYFNHTMYGYGYKGDLKADTLTKGDASGAAVLYH